MSHPIVPPQNQLERFASGTLHYVGVPTLQFMASQVLRTTMMTTLAAAAWGNAAEGPHMERAGSALVRSSLASSQSNAAVTCGVCLDKLGVVQASKCHHRLCADCAEQLTQQQRLHPVPCPFCRCPIASFEPVVY